MSSDTRPFDKSVWYLERDSSEPGRLWYFVDTADAYSEVEALQIATLRTGLAFVRARSVQAALKSYLLNLAPTTRLGTLISPADLSRMGYTLPRKGTYE